MAKMLLTYKRCRLLKSIENISIVAMNVNG